MIGGVWMNAVKGFIIACITLMVTSLTPVHAGLLFGADLASGNLLTINTTTGAATPVGHLGVAEVGGMAFDSSGTLYGVDASNQQLLTINTSTGMATPVGSFGNTSSFFGFLSLAFDGSSNTLFAVDASVTNQLYSIDTSTGAATSVGALGVPGVRGLAFNGNSGTLFGVSNNTDSLLVIDTLTGAATIIGPLGFPSVTSLAYDGETNTLFGVDLFSDALVMIDALTGTGTTIGPLGYGDVISLALKTSSVPEPSVFVLLVACLAGLSLPRRKTIKR